MRMGEWIADQARLRPLVPAAVGAFVGCVASFQAGWLALAVLPALVAPPVVLALRRRAVPIAAWIALAACAAGAVRMLAAVAPPRAAAARLAGTEGVLSGVVVTTDAAAVGGTSAWSRQRVSAPGIGAVVLTVKGPALPYGRRVEIPVRFERPEGAANPGGYDEAARLGAEGIFLLAEATGPDRSDGATVPPNPFAAAGARVREAFSAAYRAFLPPREASLMSGMLLGDVSAMADEDAEAFRRAGLSHLTAVSGSNVAFILAPAALLASKGRLGRKVRAAALAAYLMFFGYVTGWEASVTRAILMAAVALAGGVLLRRSDAASALAAACLGMLLAEPTVAFDAGFRLSALATAGLLGLARPVGSFLRALPPFRRPFPGRRAALAFLDLLAVTLSAQAAVLPVSLPLSGGISAAGFLSNPPVVPLAELVTLYGGAAGALGWILSATTGPASLACLPVRLVAAPLAGLLRFILDTAEWAAGLDALRASLPARDAALLLPAFALALAALAAGRRGIRRSLLRTAAACAAAGILALAAMPLFAPEATVVFADVGQGDLTLVLTRDGRCAVIDGGPADASGKGEGVRALEALLAYYGIDAVDAVFATHGHADHAGGLLWLLQNVPCKALYMPSGTVGAAVGSSARTGGAPGTAESLGLGALLVDAARERGCPVSEWGANDRMDCGRFLSVAALAPLPEAAAGTRDADPNARSLVLRVAVGTFSFLVAGDADGTTEDALASIAVADAGRATAGGADVDLLRVSHHGSASSTSRAFLEAVSPQAAVVSVGPNLYGHPAPALLARLAEAGIPTYRTDAGGAVLARISHGEAVVASWRKEP